MPAAKVNFNLANLTQTVPSTPKGVNFVQGRSIRGPFSDPVDIINSWPSFVNKYGGLMSDSDAPRLVKRLLEKGGSVRFSRVGHYTDITDENSLTAVKASQPNTTILFIAGEFQASNTIDLTIDGTAITQVTFDTDNETTVKALAAEIASHVDVKAAYVSKVGANSQITVTPEGTDPLAVTAISVLGGASQPTITDLGISKITDATGNPIFTIKPKYAGVDYNNLQVTIEEGNNGQAGYFNLIVQHTTDLTLVEKYTNLFIEGQPSTVDANFLADVVAQSELVDVVYEDLSYLTGQVTPLNMKFNFAGGTDGDAVDDTDYIGDSAARNGFYSFDPYQDAMQIGVFDNDNDAVHQAGSAYAANRKDLIYFLHLPNSIKSKTAMISKRNSLNIDSKFTYIMAGGLKLRDPLTGQIKDTSAIADVMALASNSDANFGEWYSFAGNNRGAITNAVGVVNNFGAPATFKDLDDLANAHINMVINRDNAIKLWGNFSGQYKDDQEKFLSVVRLIIFLKKSLRPTLEDFVEEPNDIPTWKRLFYTVKPFMDSLVTKRALHSYTWNGDQDAASMDQLQFNNATDVTNGKYRVQLDLQAISSIQELTIDMVLTPAGVDFEVSDLL